MTEDAARRVAVSAVEVGMEAVNEWSARRAGDPSEVDGVVEQAVIAQLHRVDPETAVVGEVAGGDSTAARFWVVDPVDGTANLLAGDPFVAVTVALVVDDHPVAGATGCPFTGELWSAAEGAGAYDRRGQRLGPADRRHEVARIVLDPPVSNPEHLATWNAVRSRLAETFGPIELRGAIALELAYVAAGVFDGTVQVGGSPLQDFASGVLLIREAGGVVTGCDGRADVWRSELVVAGDPQTHRQLFALLCQPS